MPNSLHDLRTALIAVLGEFRLGRVAQMKALDQCRTQLENRSLAEGALLIAGHEGSNFMWNAELELYLDISRAGQDAGFISKGWTDPGFRVGEIVIIPTVDVPHFMERVETVQHVCATNGFACTVTDTPDGSAVQIDCVIYSTGFDGRTLSQTLSALARCSKAALE